MRAGENTEKRPSASRRALLALDWFERVLLLALYAGLVIRTLSNLRPEHLATDLLARMPLLLSEGLVILFILIRRKTEEISLRLSDWVIALGATGVPLLVEGGQDAALIPIWLGALLVLVGVVIQLVSKIALGRSLGCVPAHRGLKLEGPYRLVRHPIYLGYLVSHLGFLLVNATLRNVLVYVVAYGLQIPRLLREEQFLSQDERYKEYQKEVRYRLLPGVF